MCTQVLQWLPPAGLRPVRCAGHAGSHLGGGTPARLLTRAGATAETVGAAHGTQERYLKHCYTRLCIKCIPYVHKVVGRKQSCTSFGSWCIRFMQDTMSWAESSLVRVLALGAPVICRGAQDLKPIQDCFLHTTLWTYGTHNIDFINKDECVLLSTQTSIVMCA